VAIWMVRVFGLAATRKPNSKMDDPSRSPAFSIPSANTAVECAKWPTTSFETESTTFTAMASVATRIVSLIL
jgi:hypothetical protein